MHERCFITFIFEIPGDVVFSHFGITAEKLETFKNYLIPCSRDIYCILFLRFNSNVRATFKPRTVNALRLVLQIRLIQKAFLSREQ